MRFANVLAATMGLVVLPTVAWAQDEEGNAPAAETQEGQTGEGNASDKNVFVSASGYATTDQPFRPRRGLFLDGEAGLFGTFLGRNADNPEFGDVAVSNPAPYLALTLGYDVVQSTEFALNIGLKVGAAFNSGSSRLSAADLNQVGPQGARTFANDYAMYEVGLNLGFIIRLNERLSLPIRLNGGLLLVDPNVNVDYCGGDSSSPGPSPTLDTDPDTGTPSDANIADFRAQCRNQAGDITVGAGFAVGTGIEFFTLLQGLSGGVLLRFQGAFVDGEFIPGMSFLPLFLRYTF